MGTVEYRAKDFPSKKPRNSAAIVSLLLSLLFFVPILTGAGAIVCGLIGLKRGRNPAVSGRRMAAAGVALGLLSLSAWTYPVALFTCAYVQRPGVEAVCRRFLLDLSAGNQSGAQGLCDGTQIDTISSDSQRLSRLGPPFNVSISSCQLILGQREMEVMGDISGSFGKEYFLMFVRKQQSTYVITYYEMRAEP